MPRRDGRGYDCNLSPRGDGNPVCMGRGFSAPPIAIYPREGTETLISSSAFWVRFIAIYPREGTETCVPPALWPGLCIAIYPREGTETFGSCCKSPTSSIAIYPREGTETKKIAVALMVGDCNLSPRGDGNIRDVVAADFHAIAIYPREGTETVRGWRSFRRRH